MQVAQAAVARILSVAVDQGQKVVAPGILTAAANVRPVIYSFTQEKAIKMTGEGRSRR